MSLSKKWKKCMNHSNAKLYWKIAKQEFVADIQGQAEPFILSIFERPMQTRDKFKWENMLTNL